MGLFDGIKAVLLKRKIQKVKKTSALEKSIDGMLAEEMKTMTSTNRTIDKLLKVKIMRQETQHTLDKIGELDQEFEGEEVEEGESFEDQIKQMLLGKIIGGGQSPQETMGGEGAPVDYGDPAAQAIPQQQNPLVDAVNKMTPDDLDQLKRKFIG